jgi:hypothetical protein
MDLRLDLGFFEHPKTVNLQLAGGHAAVTSLLRLWVWAARQRPLGDLSELSDKAIERAAGCKPGSLAQMVACGFLDGDQEGRSCHGWAERQPYVVTAPDRIAAARAAGIASGQARRERIENDSPTDRSISVERSVERIANGMRTDDERIANAVATPTPNAGTGTLLVGSPRSKQAMSRAKRSTAFSGDFERFWEQTVPDLGARGSKTAAWSVWQDIGATRPETEVLIDRYRAQVDAKRRAKVGGEFAPPFQHIERWLRKRRFDDDPSDRYGDQKSGATAVPFRNRMLTPEEKAEFARKMRNQR